MYESYSVRVKVEDLKVGDQIIGHDTLLYNINSIVAEGNIIKMKLSEFSGMYKHTGLPDNFIKQFKVGTYVQKFIG
jgi:hypothetical protein